MLTPSMVTMASPFGGNWLMRSGRPGAGSPHRAGVGLEIPWVRVYSWPGLFVVVGRLLGGLEDLWVVPIEDAGFLAVAHEPDLLVALVCRHRAPGAGDRRNQVLLEALLQVHDVAGQDHGSRLGQTHHR